MDFLNPSRLILVLVGLLLSLSAAAQIRIDDGQQAVYPRLSNLTWADRTDFERWTGEVERIGRRYYGQPLRHDKSDLDLLQRITDDRRIKQDDIETLQGLGVVLGNVLQRELGLEWKVYEDAVGRSRALCAPGTSDCLFPVTMLSRRLEVGLTVDVHKIYNDAVAAIDPYLPTNKPYSEPKPDTREKPSWIDDRPQRPPIRIRVE